MEVLIKDIDKRIEELNLGLNALSDERKQQLNELAKLVKAGCKQLVFICTHNSRRSQLAEIWFNALCNHYSKDALAFSGGTEATAFNPRMVKALTDYGFSIHSYKSTENPTYYLNSLKHKYFSKEYNHSYNPDGNFIAVMVCSDAEQNCPLVLGAKHRFALQYLDPKAFDNTAQEEEAYAKKVVEVGTELLFLIKLL